MEKNQQANNQLAVIQNSIEVFKTAPLVLTANRSRTEKALIVGNDIINKWKEAWAIPDEDQRMLALSEIDQRSLKYVVNCSGAVDEMKQQRSAITQLMDNFKSMFTEAENQIDKAKAGTAPNTIQLQRNKYAGEVVTIKRRKEKEAQDKADKAKEVIDLKAEIENKLFAKYTELLVSKKETRLRYFNEITLENFEVREGKIKEAENKLSLVELSSKPISVYGKFHNNDEIMTFISDALNEKFKEFAANYEAELSLQQEEFIDLLPSKLNELKEAKKIADEAEATRLQLQQEADDTKRKELEQQQQLQQQRQQELQQQQQQRQQQEAEKITTSAAAATQENEQKVELTSQGEKTMVEFEKEVEVQSAAPEIKTKIAFVINVLHVIGYTQIFQLWYEQEGKNLAIEKVGNTKLDQMKTFCEKLVNKGGAKIESKFLEYVEDVKAVSRKTTTKAAE